MLIDTRDIAGGGDCMKEAYFEQVISDISNLCEDLKSKREMRESKEEREGIVIESVVGLSGVDEYKQRAKDRQELYAYLTNLTDTTLNTICAMMDFGRRYECKVLPVNLEKFFNKYYLPYWFDKNENEEKSITVSYLIDKYSVLPRYLNRAKEILFYSKENNIPLVDECGGYLCLDESDGIVQVDYDMYELYLTCLKCNSKVIKIVDGEYLNQRI